MYVLFSPPGKLAGEAIYFANVFLFFNGQLSRPGSSESNMPIFSKISGLLDVFTSLSFFDF